MAILGRHKDVLSLMSAFSVVFLAVYSGAPLHSLVHWFDLQRLSKTVYYVTAVAT